MISHRPTAVLLLALLTLRAAPADASDPVWFYRAESPRGAITYLYPSDHLNDARVRRPPEWIVDQRSKLVLEVTTDQLEANTEMAMSYILSPTPVELHAYFTESEIDTIRARLTCHGVAQMIEQLRLSFISIFISFPCPNSSDEPYTYEELLELRAKTHGIEVVGLESPDEQLTALASLPDRVAIESIKEYVGDPAHVDELDERMIAAYNAGKYDDLYRMTMDEGPKNPDDKKLFWDKIVIERNRHMVERLGAILEQGNALVVIGAAHFPGPDGIVDLLRRQNYKVTEIDVSSGNLP
ncbi:MAG TPA: TraB/GumN family protein [Stellaceae bacterium]|nr:TraB/GumN family protein [Stellaceae bacterium]